MNACILDKDFNKYTARMAILLKKLCEVYFSGMTD